MSIYNSVKKKESHYTKKMSDSQNMDPNYETPCSSPPLSLNVIPTSFISEDTFAKVKKNDNIEECSGDEPHSEVLDSCKNGSSETLEKEKEEGHKELHKDQGPELPTTPKGPNLRHRKTVDYSCRKTPNTRTRNGADQTDKNTDVTLTVTEPSEDLINDNENNDIDADNKIKTKKNNKKKVNNTTTNIPKAATGKKKVRIII